MSSAIERELLLDVSRLVWRSWSRRLPTGIDRVCLAYLQNFRARAQAVVQYRGTVRVLSPSHSDQLFNLLEGPDAHFRNRLARLSINALANGRTAISGNGAFYINVGHTDLDLESLVRWTRRAQVRPIYMIHDLIPLTHAEFCRPEAIARHHGRICNAIRSASGILTNSQATSTALERFARANSQPLPPVKAALLAGAKLNGNSRSMARRGRYFVYVGTIEARKNHFMLLQIWRRLVERLGEAAPQLILIGQQGAEAHHVESMLHRCREIRDHVVLLSHCPDSQLSGWLQGAVAALFPSFAEGFGLPLVEAMQLGTPVIASDLPCFREIAEGIPTLIDPLDAAQWEKAILSFLDEGAEVKRQRRILQNYQGPSWDEHFAVVENWLDSFIDAPSVRHRPLADPVMDLRDIGNLHAADDWPPIEVFE